MADNVELFVLIHFVLGYRLFRFDWATNRIIKSTIHPSLLESVNYMEISASKFDNIGPEMHSGMDT